MPVPKEQLYNPVRVCITCFSDLDQEICKPKILATASHWINRDSHIWSNLWLDNCQQSIFNGINLYIIDEITNN